MILVPTNKVEKIKYFSTLLGLIFIEITRGPFDFGWLDRLVCIKRNYDNHNKSLISSKWNVFKLWNILIVYDKNVSFLLISKSQKAWEKFRKIESDCFENYDISWHERY